MRFFLQGITLKQLINMIIILIILVVISPASFKEWVNLHNPEILPPYWMYYALLFCISYVINGVINSSCILVISRFNESRERKAREAEIIERTAVFDSLSLKERAMLAFAVDGNDTISVKRGDETAIALTKKGLLTLERRAFMQPHKDTFRISKHAYHECYTRYSGKGELLMDELINKELPNQ